MAYLAIGTLRQWHWVSSALCLAGMLLFAVTGITLNHAGVIESRPQVTEIETQLPAPLMPLLPQMAETRLMPELLHGWLRAELGMHFSSERAEWSGSELYLGQPRPGGDAWLTLDLHSGELFYESTDRG